MKKSWLFLLILLTACSDQNEVGENSGLNQKKNENIPITKVEVEGVSEGVISVNHIATTNKEIEKSTFSYLDELPNDQLANYKLFTEDHKVRHLSSFTPEQIVLVYMHSVAIADIEGIYVLTYKGGTLPELNEYQEEYYEYLSRHDIDALIKYRDYTSLQIAEENRQENELDVVMGVEFGVHHHFISWQLKKDDNIWKLNMYPYLRELKKSETSL